MLEVYPAPPGITSDYVSSRWTVASNGTPTFVYGHNRTAYLTWGSTAGTTAEPSFVKIGTDAPVTFTVTRYLPGLLTPEAITAIEVFPKNAGITVQVSGAVATIVCPADVRAHVVVNNDWRHTLSIFCDPLADPIPVGAVNFNTLGAITSLPANSVVYFPPGVYNLGGPVAHPTVGTNYLFKLNANTKLYLQGGALLVGNFDASTAPGLEVYGPGGMSGAWTTWAATAGAGASATVLTTQAPIYSSASGAIQRRLKNVFFMRNSFFGSYNSASEWDHVHIVSPHDPNTDGVSSGIYGTGSTPLMRLSKCFIYTGDAGVTPYNAAINHEIDDCFILTPNNACVLLFYWARPISANTVKVRRCHTIQLGIADNNSLDGFPFVGANAHVAFFCDGRDDTPGWGRANVAFEDHNAWGPVLSRVLALVNKKYPVASWGAYANDAAGVTSNWSFTRFAVEKAPAQRFALWGRDRDSTPCRLFFDQVSIAGVSLTSSNYRTYADANAFPFWVFIGGIPVVTEVDIANTALTRIGLAGVVTSIAPLDGTSEAQIAALHYPRVLNTLLARHRWAFATRAVSLTAVTGGETARWPYAYPVPDNFLAMQAVLPEGATDASAGLTPAHYAIEQDASNVRRLYTDTPVALLVYTSTITDPNFLSAEAQDALGWGLAAEFATAVMKQDGIELAKYCLQRQELALAGARTTDAEQRFVEPTRLGSSIDARA